MQVKIHPSASKRSYWDCVGTKIRKSFLPFLTEKYRNVHSCFFFWKKRESFGRNHWIPFSDFRENVPYCGYQNRVYLTVLFHRYLLVTNIYKKYVKASFLSLYKRSFMLLWFCPKKKKVGNQLMKSFLQINQDWG